jgi:hypothetical protein
MNTKKAQQDKSIFQPAYLAAQLGAAISILDKTPKGGVKEWRAELLSAILWEGARAAFSLGCVKSKWLAQLPKKLPAKDLDSKPLWEIYRHDLFNKSWHELDYTVKSSLTKSIVNKKNNGAQIAQLSTWDGLSGKFKKCQERLVVKEANGSTFVIIEIQDNASVDMVLKALKTELQTIGIPNKTLRNGNDLKMSFTLLTGLRSLLLQKKGMFKKERNKTLFRTSAAKSDYDDLNAAEESAKWLIADITWQVWRMIKHKGWPPPQEKS